MTTKKDKPVTFDELTQYHNSEVKPQFDELKKLIAEGFEEIKLLLKNHAAYTKDEINGIKAEMLKFVTREELKRIN